MHEFYARSAIARWLVSTCEDHDLLREVLSADENHWEHGLEFPHHIRPSDAFDRAARSIRARSPRLTSYLGGWEPAPPPDTRPFFERRGRQWQLVEDRILDEWGRPVLDRPESLADEDWRELASTLVVAVRPVTKDDGTCRTCHQTVPTGPPPRPMVAGDLYALVDHDWHIINPGTEIEQDVCRQCGVTYSSDTRYDPCLGPEWMQNAA